MVGDRSTVSPRTHESGTQPRLPSAARVERWVRHGHDRVYVRGSAGTRLGYWDNRTNRAVLDDPACGLEFAAALASYHADQPAPVPRRAPAAVAGPTAPPAAVAGPFAASARAERPWTDLAAHRPGQLTRHQADALRRAHPVRTWLARLLRIATAERNWRVGADGEAAVGARLDRLDSRWRVLHAVPVGQRGSDIDHVVIGPGGVFTINTKTHPHADVWVAERTVRVNGFHQPYLRNSRHEADRAGRLLTAATTSPVGVHPVIALVGVHRVTIKARPAGGEVTVCTARQLTRWLRQQPPVLTGDQVAAVYAVARRSTTWTG